MSEHYQANYKIRVVLPDLLRFLNLKSIDSLAALLSITTDSLRSLLVDVDIDVLINGDSDRIGMYRLRRMLTIIGAINNKNPNIIENKLTLNLINEPIPGDTKERSLLYYIVDDPFTSDWIEATNKVLEVFNEINT
jgi:hypothetical protein